MHGEEGLMVHFSEPEMQPSEGSSKRHRWQVRTLATGPWHREQRRRNQELFQAHPGPAPPFPPDPGFNLPFRTAKPTVVSTPTSIQTLIMEFWGRGATPTEYPSPALMGSHSLDLQRQNGSDRQSEQNCCGRRGALLSEAES